MRNGTCRGRYFQSSQGQPAQSPIHNTPFRGVRVRHTPFSYYYYGLCPFSPLRDPHIGTLKIKRHAVSERRASTSDGMLAFRVCSVFSAHFANARNELEPNKSLLLL